jgi:membrane protein implicated in regulation of membrane protease activity
MIEFKKIVASTAPLLVELTRYIMSGVYRDLEKQALQIVGRLYSLHILSLVSAIFFVSSFVSILFIGTGWFLEVISFAKINFMFFVAAFLIFLLSIVSFVRISKVLKDQAPKESPSNLENIFEQVTIVLKKIQEEDKSDVKPNSIALEKRMESMENSILLLIQAMETKSQPDSSLKYSRLKDL